MSKLVVDMIAPDYFSAQKIFDHTLSPMACASPKAEIRGDVASVTVLRGRSEPALKAELT
jgi:hypothetical protein